MSITYSPGNAQIKPYFGGRRIVDGGGDGDGDGNDGDNDVNTADDDHDKKHVTSGQVDLAKLNLAQPEPHMEFVTNGTCVKISRLG